MTTLPVIGGVYENYCGRGAAASAGSGAAWSDANSTPICATLGHHPPGRGVHAHVGDLVEPLAKLQVQIVEIAKPAAEKEVLADVAIRTLYLTLGLCPIRPGQAFGK